jgi:mannosyltransferase
VPSKKYLPAFLLILVALVATSTAFYGLGFKGLWGDEVWEAMWSQQQGLLETFQRFKSPPDLPLHFVLTHISTLFGDGEFFVRLPAALLGVGTVITLFVLGTRLFGVGVGLLAALLLALAPYHVWYAQEARPYAGLSFYSLVSLLFFWLLLERVTILRVAGFLLATCLNIYNHLFGVLPLVTEGVVAALWALSMVLGIRRLGPDARRALYRRVTGTLLALGGAVLLAFALAFPLLEGVLAYVVRGGPFGGEQAAPARFDFTPTFFIDLFSLFGAGAGWAFWLMFLLFLVGVGFGLRERRSFTTVALVWLAVPPFVMWAAQPQHMFIARYFLFMQPVYLLMVAYGLIRLVHGLLSVGFRSGERVDSRAGVAMGVGVVLGLGLCVLTFAPTVRGYSVEKVNNWSAVCSYLWKHTECGDLVIGDAYVDGTMNWCFNVKSGAPYVPVERADRVDIQDIVGEGRGIWYINVDPSAPDLESVRREFQEVARSEWAKPGLIPTTGGDPVAYLQGETEVKIYRYLPAHPPPRLSFHEVRGSDVQPNWPDYAQVPAGRSYCVRLALPPTAPRQLRVVALRLEARPIEVLVDGSPIHMIAGGTSNSTWEDVVIPLPSAIGEAFNLQLTNPGDQTSAVSSVAVEWISNP